MQQAAASSARREQLLESAYRYVLVHGLTDLSLRPLAAAIGSSPRVLLFLFESKDGLIKALLTRARDDERHLIEDLRRADTATIRSVALRIWQWLAEPGHRGLLTLWVESYSRSLIDPVGAWGGFASATVTEWLGLLADAQPEQLRHAPPAVAERTLVLAVLRGALIDLLATNDQQRTTAAVELAIRRTTASQIRSEHTPGTA